MNKLIYGHSQTTRIRNVFGKLISETHALLSCCALQLSGCLWWAIIRSFLSALPVKLNERVLLEAVPISIFVPQL